MSSSPDVAQLERSLVTLPLANVASHTTFSLKHSLQSTTDETRRFSWSSAKWLAYRKEDAQWLGPLPGLLSSPFFSAAELQQFDCGVVVEGHRKMDREGERESERERERERVNKNDAFAKNTNNTLLSIQTLQLNSTRI